MYSNTSFEVHIAENYSFQVYMYFGTNLQIYVYFSTSLQVHVLECSFHVPTGTQVQVLNTCTRMHF